MFVLQAVNELFYRPFCMRTSGTVQKNVTALMKEEKEACVLVHWAVINRGARYKGDVCELL